MKLLVVVSALALCASASTHERIVGGSAVLISSAPYIVAVEVESHFYGFYDQICGGTIITSNFVLTAGSCLYDQFKIPALTRVRAGSDRRLDGGTIHPVNNWLIHPEFSYVDSKQSDIAIINLAQSIVYGPTTAAGTLAAATTVLPVGTGLIAYGFGDNSASGDNAGELRGGLVTIVDTVSCQAAYDSELQSLNKFIEITGNVLCTSAAPVDTCDGDAGSPIIIQDIVVGITSWGLGCGSVPTLSTWVPSYVNWVVSAVNGWNVMD